MQYIYMTKVVHLLKQLNFKYNIIVIINKSIILINIETLYVAKIYLHRKLLEKNITITSKRAIELNFS